MTQYIDSLDGSTGSSGSPLDEPPDLNGDPNESAKWAKHWSTELASFKRWARTFAKNGDRCEDAYADERDAYDGSDSRVNLFWSTTQVIMSAIYGRLPEAEVGRRFKDQDDDVARVAGEILQRCLNTDLDRESNDTVAALRDALQDRFVVGLGQVWCRYEVETEPEEYPAIGPDGMPTGEMEQGERIVSEKAEVDYVYWKDFAYTPSRRWRDVVWVARRVYMTKRQLMARFKMDDKAVADVPMSGAPKGASAEDPIKARAGKVAPVWEIWCKDSNRAYWYVEGMATCLDIQEDPLQLNGFFPCPQPVVATTLTKAFLPKAEYIMAQDLYRELDDINNRLSIMQRSLRVAGVYDKNNEGLKRLLSENADNAMIPVENWTVLSEKGGIRGAVDWFPLEQVVNTMLSLSQRKEQVEADLFEVLGVSDILRGASDPSETATAQSYKVQFGGARLGQLQNNVARFVSDASRIKGEIIARHFQPQTIVQLSQIQQTTDAQLAEPAVMLLKNTDFAMFQIKVDADTLAAPDWQMEQNRRTQFLTAVSQYLMQAFPVAQQDPQAGIVLLQMLQWAVAGFKGANGIEAILDQAVEGLQQQMSQPQEPQEPAPAEQKDMASAEKQRAEAEQIQLETQVGKEQINARRSMMGLPLVGAAEQQGPPGMPPPMPMPQQGLPQ